MKIYYENPNKEIKNLVMQKAKYQKVMLIFDDNISNLEIAKIHDSIKEFCVYNCCHISSLTQEEINDGYRLLIFRCLAESFFELELNLTEFVCVFYPENNSLLPFFLEQDSLINNSENYLLLDEAKIDISMLSSVQFNLFYNYFQNILSGNSTTSFFELQEKEITQQNVLDILNIFNKTTFFLDLNIIKNEKMEYADTVFLDLILINAFELLIQSIKQQNLMLVDVFKAGKDDEKFIEKSYKLYNNDVFTNLILLNYNCLINFCKKTKGKIKELIPFVQVDMSRIDAIFENVKNYSKNDKGLMAFIYLFNFFDV